MAKTNVNTPAGSDEKQPPTWTADLTTFFQRGFSEIKAVLTVLTVNVGEYKSGDGRATDEALFLAVQQIETEARKLEEAYYGLNGQLDGTGELGTQLMWARSLLEILETMGFSDPGWKFNLTDEVLCGYFARIERAIDLAAVEVERLHSTMPAEAVPA